MNSHLKKILVTVTVACTFGLLGTTSAEAWYGNKHCWWVGGHYRDGHWVPRHKVCRRGWDRNRSGIRCRWVNHRRVCWRVW